MLGICTPKIYVFAYSNLFYHIRFFLATFFACIFFGAPVKNYGTMSIYTELVLEARELNDDIDGVTTNETNLKYKIRRSDIAVKTPEAAKALGRKAGRYITIEAKEILERSLESNLYLGKQIGKALSELISGQSLPKDFLTLVVGIGNRGMTADALGPKVVDNLIVTRHIREKIETRFGSVCAIAPGVLGETGIESFDVIQGLVGKVKPDLVIAVDSLASRRTERISTTFQFSDTGLTPGGGLYNSRPALNRESLGVPVIALGVPFVVYARTMGQDVVEELFRRLPSYAAPNAYQVNHSLKSVVTDMFGDLVVTPKEIDQIIKDCAFVLGLGINLALHNKLSAEDILSLNH
jgi:spore protease